MQRIARFQDSTSVDVTFTDAAATTGGFSFGLHAGAVLFVKSTTASEAIVITFGARPEASSSQFFVACDASNGPITLTVQPDRCYALPDSLFASAYVAATAAAGKSVTCSILMKG
jgi:hypothetical protein